MDLLLSSKRAWLLSYAIFSFLAICLYFIALDSAGGKTTLILISEMQVLMLLFFFLIIIFKWKGWCRTILAILYLGGTIHLGVNHIISKWYVIVPISIILLVYMIWNIGGIVNCIVANRYKMELDRVLAESKQSYGDYKDKVGQYNIRNELGFWTKIHTKREPNWNRLGFNSSGLNMFSFEDALFGVNTLDWERRISKMSRINSGLSDKHSALDNNSSLFEEKELIGRIIEKSDGIDANTDIFTKQDKILNTEIASSRKKERKILRRKL